MRPHNNISFQKMLIKIRKSFFNIEDITILYSKVAITIYILNPNEHIIIV